MTDKDVSTVKLDNLLQEDVPALHTIPKIDGIIKAINDVPQIPLIVKGIGMTEIDVNNPDIKEFIDRILKTYPKEEMDRIIREATIIRNKDIPVHDASKVDVNDTTIIWNPIQIPHELQSLSKQTIWTLRKISDYGAPIPRGCIDNELDKDILIHLGILEECVSDKGSFQLTDKGKKNVELLDVMKQMEAIRYRMKQKY